MFHVPYPLVGYLFPFLCVKIKPGEEDDGGAMKFTKSRYTLRSLVSESSLQGEELFHSRVLVEL